MNNQALLLMPSGKSSYRTARVLSTVLRGLRKHMYLYSLLVLMGIDELPLQCHKIGCIRTCILFTNLATDI